VNHLIARLSLLVFAIIVIAVASFLWASEIRRHAFARQPHLAKALEYDVRILRDEFGVPHIYGKRDADTAFGLAYAHCEDDFATFQDVVMLVRGRSSELVGEAGGVNDYLVQLLGVHQRLDARYESDIPAETRAVLDAYAAGLNLYAAEHSGDVVAGLMPVTGKDIAAGFTFRTPFFYGFQRVLEQIMKPAEPKANEGPGAQSRALYRGLTDFQIGSNAAALAPSRSADGATRLLVNSHQPWTGPVSWYEVRVKSEEGWDMAGGVFVGSPFVLHGIGPNLGWANTVNRPDLADTYVLKLNPDNPNQYMFDGLWRDLERGVAKIKVHIWGPLAITVERETLRSVHGPVLKTDHGAYAMRYAGMDEVRQVAQYHRLNRAKTHPEFEAALAMQALPSLNYVYADKTGTIAYYYNGTFPKRKSGFEWNEPLPGDISDDLWTEFLPFSAVPKLVSPRTGFVISANSSPFQATADPANLQESKFPKEMGVETRMTNRGLRFVELLGSDPVITDEEFVDYKMDRRYSSESQMGRLVAELLAMDFSSDPLLREAQDLLRKWDLRATQDSTATALAVLTATPVLVPTLEGKPRQDLVTFFRRAAQTLKTRFGRIDVPWGVLNVMRRGSLTLPLDGSLDVPRAIEYQIDPTDSTLKLNEDGTLISVGGDSLILIGVWDPSGSFSVRSIHNFGSAVLDASSRHYADQAPLFAREQWKTIHMDEGELRQHLEREYRPGRPL
jgi:acyl-homoserine-lactone acylase